jgi:hypothetical protein
MSVIDAMSIPGIDWTKPETITDEGKKVYSVRCRFPFSGLASESATKATGISRSENSLDLSDVVDEMGLSERVIIDDGDGILLQPDATGDPGADDEVDWSDLPLLSGIASSTSVDFYGTEMSMRALKQMAVQMMSANGVPYLPKHNNGSLGAVEWDQVIGRTVHAEVVPAEEVRQSYCAAEAQFILRVTARLYDDEDLSKSLLRRVQRGEPIGQSIGGWFTHLQVIQNDEGDVERVIVQGVELDHLAVTRAPANPDSVGLVSLRSKFQDQADIAKVESLEVGLSNKVTLSKRQALVVRESLEERHVIGWKEEEDDTITITFKRYSEDEEGDYDKEKAEAQLAVGQPELVKEPGLTNKDRSISKFSDLPLAAIDTDWGWSTDAANRVLGDPPEWTRYRRAHIWYDADNSVVKAGYKLPFAKMIDGELKAVWRGVSAAMGAVNGARGGVNISDEQRRSAYSHLSKYYDKFEKEPPEFQASVDTSIDNASKTEHDKPGNDAGTSAPTIVYSTQAESISKASEEHVMNEQLLESLRSLLKDELQPLSERVQSLETRNEVVEETQEVAQETDDSRIAEAERTAKDAMERAQSAEKKLDQLVRTPIRHGRSLTPHIDPGPAAAQGYEGLVSRARVEAPTLSAVADRCISIVTEENGAASVSRRLLEDSLRSLLNAAEQDGIITNPAHRSNWS